MNIRNLIRQVRLRFHGLLRSPTDELSRGGQFLSYQTRLWWFCGRKLIKDRLTVTASALSFKTLLSLVPMVILFSLVLTLIPEGDVREGVRNAVYGVAGLETISYRPADIDVIDDGTPATDGAVPLRPEVAEGNQRARSLADWLTVMVESVVEDIRSGKGSLTVISVVLFIWIGMSVFRTVEGAFNHIWEVRKGRGVVTSFRDFVTSMIVLVLFLGLATWSTVKFQQVSWVVTAFGWVVPLVFTVLLFFVIYKTLPTVPVQTNAALTAATIAGVLWELGAKTALVLYLRYTFGGTIQLYGSLALVPVFMLWLWISWVIVLFGAEVAYVIQHMSDMTREELESEAGGRFLRGDVVALAVSAAVVRAFDRGAEPPSRHELGDATGGREGDVQEVLDALRAAGLLRVAERSDGQSGYVPAVPPEQIVAARVAEVGASVELAPPEEGERGEMLRWAREYMNEISTGASAALAGETLESLSRRSIAS